MTKLGMFVWFSYSLPLEERMRLIKEAGFEAVSLWWGAADREQQPALARAAGLMIDNAHAPFRGANSLWSKGEEGDAHLKELTDTVEDCARHGIKTAVIHAAGFRDIPDVNPIGMDRIGRLVAFAEKKGVRLAFENLCALSHLDEILRTFPTETVGFCYDSGHENRYHPDARCLTKYGSQLMAIHLDDNFGDGDTHLLPFDGSADWATILPDLQSARPLPYLTLEVDFDKNSPHSQIYKELSAEEYLCRAYEKAVQIAKKMGLR